MQLLQFSRSVVSDSLQPHGLHVCQASLSITNSQSPPKPMSIESVMPSNHLILCCPLLLLPSIFPSIRVFSNESASTSVPPMNVQDWFPLGWTSWISLQSKGLSRVFFNTTVQKHQFFAQTHWNYNWDNVCAGQDAPKDSDVTVILVPGDEMWTWDRGCGAKALEDMLYCSAPHMPFNLCEIFIPVEFCLASIRYR